MKSFRNQDTHTYCLLLLNRPEKQQATNFGGKTRHGLPDKSNGMKSTVLSLSLLVCMSVLARNILCQRPCSLCSYVCNGLPGPAHPHKVKFCLIAFSYMGRETITYIRAERTRPLTQNISGQYRHTYEQREGSHIFTVYLGIFLIKPCF